MYREYGFEEHFAKTRDDYLLCLHRIKEGRLGGKHRDLGISKKGASIINQLDSFKQNNMSNYNGKPVVLLYHGLTLTSEVWISNVIEERNLAFYLVERGYDVWMGNARGNKYSQSHLTKNPNNADFWEFSINEFALLDMPDTIDVKALNDDYFDLPNYF
jgi:lysosomal acid lipase/cholesteryl ester hydrolase